MSTPAKPTVDPFQFVAKVEQVLALLTQGPVAAAGGVAQLLPLASGVLSVLAPGLAVAGMPVIKLLAIAGGLLSGAPDLQNAYQAVKAAVTGGAAPTAAQWAAFDAAADQAHADFQAAIAAYAAGG